MPTYNGIEVWIEDTKNRKLNHQAVMINSVDGRTVTVKTEMLRDEHYTVHCLSPISVFCDVFVITASLVRNRAARFHLDKNLAISENAPVWGSSTDHTEGRFRDHGIRTPKRQFQHGKLGSLEVEIRRIGDIIRGERRGESEADEDDEEVTTELSMIDDFDQPPWFIFHFDISAKESPAVPAPKHAHRRHLPYGTLKNSGRAMSGTQPGTSSTEGSINETGSGCFCNPKKRPREDDDDDDGSTVIDENPTEVNSDHLQQEYQEEAAEEQRLLLKLQERLQAKKARNEELRRLLGETP